MRILIVPTVILLISLSNASSAASSNGLDDIQVTTHGHEADGDFCADFELSAPQVRGFLARAATVDAMTLHDHYDTLPCWVRGTARDAHGLWHWEIRAGGTARLESPAGEVRLLGCDACDQLLGGSKR